MYEADVRGGRPTSLAGSSCARCCCRCCTACAAAATRRADQYNLLFRWFVGLAIRTACGSLGLQQEPRSAHQARRRHRLFTPPWRWPTSAGCCRASTSAWTAHSSRPWASHKSMQRKDGSDDGRPPRTGAVSRAATTHESTSDPDRAVPQRQCRLRAELPGPCVDGQPPWSGGQRAGQHLGQFTAERDVAAQMLADVAAPGKRVTVGADKAYDTKGFVKACREISVTPRRQNLNRNGGSAIDGRTTRHPGYRSANERESASSSASAGGKAHRHRCAR